MRARQGADVTSCCSEPCSSALPGRGALLAGEELGFLHELPVPRFLAPQPVGVRLALERRRVERALLHELLPFRRLLDLLQEVDVVLGLLPARSARHEDAAQHQVVDIEALLLARRDIAPGLLGYLPLVRK